MTTISNSLSISQQIFIDGLVVFCPSCTVGNMFLYSPVTISIYRVCVYKSDYKLIKHNTEIQLVLV